LLAGLGAALAHPWLAPGGAAHHVSLPPGVAVVNGHVLLGATNGGTWHDVSPVPAGPQDLVGATFVSSTTGWAAVAEMADAATKDVLIFRTSDGGATWQRVTLPWMSEGHANLLDLQFVDARHGWLMVALNEATSRRSGLLFGTSDGGATWTQLSAPYGGALRFLDSSTGWLVGGGVNYARNRFSVTHDGGRTWQPQPLVNPAAFALSDREIGTPAFFSAQDGVLPVNFGTQLVLYATHDGGATWLATATTFPVAATDRSAVPLLALSGRDAWIVVGAGFYTTHDGGQTWAQVAHSANLKAVQALSLSGATSGWAKIATGPCSEQLVGRCNDTLLLTTADGGATWANGTRAARP
jgi:photosystem II stability/assembly factor-like uncharacterized protein